MEDKFVHIFEEAGLGKAPFTFEYAIWDNWDNCQLCFHEIKQKCFIKDANGKMFYVGNECVNKTGDQGLINVAKEKINELKRKMRHEREQKQILTARMFLYGSAYKLQPVLISAEKSPLKRPESVKDFIRDRMRYGGTKYKLDISKFVMKLAKEVLTQEEFDYLLGNIEFFAQKLDEEIRLEREAEQRELERRQAERIAKQKEIEAENQFLIDILKPMTMSGFAQDMASRLKYSELKEFSPRQIEVLADIYGKTFGKRGTKEYANAYAEVYWKGIQTHDKTN